jgi:hypothetical protein
VLISQVPIPAHDIDVLDVMSSEAAEVLGLGSGDGERRWLALVREAMAVER